jgi:hypothetical protein
MSAETLVELISVDTTDSDFDTTDSDAVTTVPVPAPEPEARPLRWRKRTS